MHIRGVGEGSTTLTLVVNEQGASAEIIEKIDQHSVLKELKKKEKAEKWHQARK